MGDPDRTLAPMERVVDLTVGNANVAYPFAFLEEHPVIDDTVGGQDLVVFHVGGTLSPFHGANTATREVGSSGVFEPFLDGEKLTFRAEDNVFVDHETGSRWMVLGKAVEGPLEGSELIPVAHANYFWFAWAAFFPDTAVQTAENLAL